MNSQDVIQLRGAFKILIQDLLGQKIKLYEIDNVVVTAGRRWILQQIQSVNHATAQNMNFVAVGSSTVAPVTGDTALGLEVTRKAVSSIDTINLTSVTPNINFLASFATNEANTTLAEVGLLNSSSAGTMLARATFASFVKATSNTVNVTYTISA